ncbi:MAG: multicopper oxidase domain-containing protein [Burkholderiales bacterium]|nr:multicopper oxidase domain-containing protein [Burkholderiales bacterium]
MTVDTQRRNFLRAAGATAVAGALPFAPWSSMATAATDKFTPDVDIELVAQPDELQLLPGRPTAVWRYVGRVLKGPADALQTIPGSYAGPIFRLKTGQKVRIRFLNRIRQPSIVHWHGLIVPEQMDGHPRDVVPTGGEHLYEFEVRNRAGTYWFHPHPHGHTGTQVYGGLAGLFLVSDDEERAARLPDGDRDISIVLADRTFDAANQLVYEGAMGGGMMGGMTGFFGERILANGRPSLSFPGAAGAYRLRLLNGSNSRIYRIARSDRKSLVAIASDGGLLAAPVTRPFLVLGPAERAELWLDFHDESAGSRIALIAEPLDFGGPGMGMMGRGRGAPAQPAAPQAFALFTIGKGAGRQALPNRLADLALATVPRETQRREFALTMGHMRWGINGRTFEMEAVAPDERVRFGDTEVWEFSNRTSMMAMPHPMHIHAAQFRVIERLGTPPGLAGLRAGFLDGGVKDTVLVLPGERVRVLLTFNAFRGLFLYHCHNLVHEDMGMMRNFRIA